MDHGGRSSLSSITSALLVTALVAGAVLMLIGRPDWELPGSHDELQAETGAALESIDIPRYYLGGNSQLFIPIHRTKKPSEFIFFAVTANFPRQMPLESSIAVKRTAESEASGKHWLLQISGVGEPLSIPMNELTGQLRVESTPFGDIVRVQSSDATPYDGWVLAVQRLQNGKGARNLFLINSEKRQERSTQAFPRQPVVELRRDRNLDGVAAVFGQDSLWEAMYSLHVKILRAVKVWRKGNSIS